MSAASGDVEAINRILKHYEGYIAVLSTRKLYDEYGNLHYCVDETLRRRLETKLITKILKFKRTIWEEIKSSRKSERNVFPYRRRGKGCVFLC